MTTGNEIHPVVSMSVIGNDYHITSAQHCIPFSEFKTYLITFLSHTIFIMEREISSDNELFINN